MGATTVSRCIPGENNGYCTGSDQEAIKDQKNGCGCCNEPCYMCIDWHVLGDQNPQTYKEEA